MSSPRWKRLANYRERLKKGLCTQCGKAPQFNKTTLCEHHLKIKKETYTRARKQAIQCGQCIECKAPLQGKVRCQRCKDANARVWRERRADLVKKGICWKCGVRSALASKTMCQPCETERITKATAQKQAVMDAYGRVCACCGENRLSFLSVDHIKGGGNKHKKEIKKNGGMLFYTWLRRNNFPPGFQVLCMNCNTSKRAGTHCFHSTENRFVINSFGKVGTTEASITIDSLASAMGKICRYAGNSTVFYPVLLHSMVVAELLPPHLKIYGLVHDMAETAISDVPSPFKVPELANIEAKIWKTMLRSLQIREPHEDEWEIIKVADKEALIGEIWTIAASPLREFFPDRSSHAEELTLKYLRNYPASECIKSDGLAILEFTKRYRDYKDSVINA